MWWRSNSYLFNSLPKCLSWNVSHCFNFFPFHSLSLIHTRSFSFVRWLFSASCIPSILQSDFWCMWHVGMKGIKFYERDISIFFGNRFSNIHCVPHKIPNFSHQLWIIALHNCDLASVWKLHGFEHTHTWSLAHSLSHTHINIYTHNSLYLFLVLYFALFCLVDSLQIIIILRNAQVFRLNVCENIWEHTFFSRLQAIKQNSCELISNRILFLRLTRLKHSRRDSTSEKGVQNMKHNSVSLSLSLNRQRKRIFVQHQQQQQHQLNHNIKKVVCALCNCST